MARWLGFPNPVNEKAARVVAAGVVLMAAGFVVTGSTWLLVPLAYGFVARVLAGPRFSPLGRFAVGVAAARLGPPMHVPGPPKRFAQGIGSVVSGTGVALALAGATGAARLVIGLLGAAALLEAAFALCVGCRVFAVLMRAGLIPASVCAECDDVTGRLATATQRA